MSIKSDDVSAGSQPVQVNPVGSQLDRLRVAFGR
jgi:hypothetical protein